MKENIQSLSGRHIVPIVVVAVVGVVASVIAWHFAATAENQTLTGEFNGRANNQALVLQNGIGDYIDRIYAVRAFFDASGDGVVRDEFEGFSRSLLKQAPAILNIAWAPLVKREQRIAHEKTATREGIVNYKIRDIAPDGSLALSPERAEYLPRFYSTEPHTSPVYGLNLNDGGSRQQAIERARDEDIAVGSPPIMLLTGIGDRHGFWIALPIYAHSLPHDTEDSRRRNFLGIVQGVFQIGTMVDSIFGKLTTPVRLYFFAPGAVNGDLSIFATSRVDHKQVSPESLETLTAGLHRSFTVVFGDAQWTLVIAPVSAALVSADRSRSWLMLISGLLLTGAATAHTWSSRRYAHKLELANERISNLASTDALTDLANRRDFLSRLTQAFAAAKRGSDIFAVLYFDLDDFKAVNDTFGHPVGDLLLRRVAERILQAVRKTDVAARFGGDEFAVLQSNVDNMKSVITLAAKLVRVIGMPYAIGEHTIHISASIGIALYSADVKDPESIMMESDLALYRAKDAGRNCFRFYDESIDNQAPDKVTMSSS